MVQKQIRKIRLFSSRIYKNFGWSCCILKAKERYKELSKQFDSLFPLKDKNIFYQQILIKINGELEVLDDFFDWLQVD